MSKSVASLGFLLFAVSALWMAMLSYVPLLTKPAAERDDSVATELRAFRTLTDTGERVRAVKRFGKVRDPRVVVTLMEVVQYELRKDWRGATSVPPLLMWASSILVYNHIPEEEWRPAKYWDVAELWWQDHEAEVRQKASALPR